MTRIKDGDQAYMTAFRGPYDQIPGELSATAAPLRKVTRLSEMAPVNLADLQGNPRDKGRVWPLIARYVNGAEEFDFGVYELAENEYHPLHYHPAGAEFYYVIEGSCLVTVDDEMVEASAGTAVYLPAGTPHAVRTRAGETMTMVYGFSSGDFRDVGTTWLE
ncbi:MAG: cupin domain-containing protein [Chloroflexi bacterium]|nr:MAG: cupin domain-containing protein [Chloroflexota bacterium]